MQYTISYEMLAQCSVVIYASSKQEAMAKFKASQYDQSDADMFLTELANGSEPRVESDCDEE